MSVVFGYRHVAGIPPCPCRDPGNYMAMEQPGDDPLTVLFRCWCGIRGSPSERSATRYGCCPADLQRRSDMADGTRLTARPTTYNGIAMRSRLEARYASWLDDRGFAWQYEPRCFATQEGQYLPDFVVHNVTFLEATLDVYVEVKPLISRWDDETALRNARIISESEPSAVLVIEAADHGHTVLVSPPRWTNPGFYNVAWSKARSGDPVLFVHLSSGWREVA